MIKKIAIALAICSVWSCQDYGNVVKVANLSRSLAEISGIAIFPESNRIYAIADHGNPNSVFALDETGTIVQEIEIANAENEDWEALATDGKNKLFIGDFGNNENERSTLTIYSIENFTALKKEVDTAFAQKTTFTLADQKNYPPKLKNRNFDIEAFIFKNGNFYLFTRNRSRNFDGTTKVYRIPAGEGNYEALPIGEYKLCGDDRDCFVTDATLAPDGQTVLLLTYNKIFMLMNYKDDDFFSGKVEKFKLEHRSQKEGIAYGDKTMVYIVDERRAQTGGNLYTYDFKERDEED